MIAVFWNLFSTLPLWCSSKIHHWNNYFATAFSVLVGFCQTFFRIPSQLTMLSSNNKDCGLIRTGSYRNSDEIETFISACIFPAGPITFYFEIHCVPVGEIRTDAFYCVHLPMVHHSNQLSTFLLVISINCHYSPLLIRSAVHKAPAGA